MPIPKGTKKTDKARQYQQQFAKENYKVAACQISKEKYNRFQEYAKGQGKNVSRVLSEYIDKCLSDIGSDPGQQPE